MGEGVKDGDEAFETEFVTVVGGEDDEPGHTGGGGVFLERVEGFFVMVAAVDEIKDDVADVGVSRGVGDGGHELPHDVEDFVVVA